MADCVTPGSISAAVLAPKQGSPVQFFLVTQEKIIVKVSKQKPTDHTEVVL